MANVRFFRLNNLPEFNPVYKGIFVYVANERTLGAGERFIYGWPVTHPVPSDLSDTVTGTSVSWSSAAAITPVTHPTDNPTPLEGLDFRRFYDETNGGNYVTVGLPQYWEEGEIIRKGLWFGGEWGWELLTNYGTNDGISWDDLYDWFNGTNETGTNSEGYVVAGEAEIFEANDIHNSNPEQYGIEYTIYDPVLDMENGLHANTDDSEPHNILVGDGALEIDGYGPLLENDSWVAVQPFDIHSANDVKNGSLSLAPGLTLTKGSETEAPYSATIGVFTKSQVTPTNPIVTLNDVTGLSGAMHLIRAISQQSELPGTDNNGVVWGNGDTLIVTNGFVVNTSNPIPTGWNGPNGEVFEAGDTLVYLDSDWRHIQGNLTVGVDQGFIPKVSDAQGSPTEGLALDTNNNEKHKLIATDGTGVYKTDIPVDFLDDLLVGIPEIDVQETAEGQDQAPQGSDSDQDLNHEIELTHTYQIGAGSSDVYTHSLIINTPNKSIDIQVPTNTSDDPEVVTVDLVWREWLD